MKENAVLLLYRSRTNELFGTTSSRSVCSFVYPSTSSTPELLVHFVIRVDLNEETVFLVLPEISVNTRKRREGFLNEERHL